MKMGMFFCLKRMQISSEFMINLKKLIAFCLIMGFGSSKKTRIIVIKLSFPNFEIDARSFSCNYFVCFTKSNNKFALLSSYCGRPLFFRKYLIILKQLDYKSCSLVPFSITFFYILFGYFFIYKSVGNK